MNLKENKLIAEFMGLDEENDQYPSDIPDEIFGNFFDNEIKYSTSWNWLMPVLEKISRMRIGDGMTYVDFAYPRTFGMLNEDSGEIMVRLNGHQLFQADTLLEATYLAVVDFIKWHTEMSKNVEGL